MGNSTPVALGLSAVTYTYPKSRSGVRDVTLAVPSGSIYGLLGVNGAGKTTLMRLMIGLLEPQRGEVRCMGEDLAADRRARLSHIGSLVETPSVYSHLTGREHLGIFAEYTSAPRRAVDEALDLVGIADAGGRLVGQYSLGMKQRLALATALLHDPSILVLDEPTNGLDPVGIAAMRDLLVLLSRERGKTIVVSSHQLAEVQRTATHVGIVHGGELRFEGTIGELGAATERTLRLRVSSPERAAELLGASATAEDLEAGVVRVAAGDEASAAAAIRRLVEAGVDVFEAVPEAGSLERDFLRVVEDESDARQSAR
jgi:ABC-type multidrug transport system ATPase subunit